MYIECKCCWNERNWEWVLRWWSSSPASYPSVGIQKYCFILLRTVALPHCLVEHHLERNSLFVFSNPIASFGSLAFLPTNRTKSDWGCVVVEWEHWPFPSFLTLGSHAFACTPPILISARLRRRGVVAHLVFLPSQREFRNFSSKYFTRKIRLYAMGDKSLYAIIIAFHEKFDSQKRV